MVSQRPFKLSIDRLVPKVLLRIISSDPACSPHVPTQLQGPAPTCTTMRNRGRSAIYQATHYTTQGTDRRALYTFVQQTGVTRRYCSSKRYEDWMWVTLRFAGNRRKKSRSERNLRFVPRCGWEWDEADGRCKPMSFTASPRMRPRGRRWRRAPACPPIRDLALGATSKPDSG